MCYVEVTKLSILRYKDKEVGYRLSGDTVLDVSKEDFDNLGGIDYSDVTYIDLYANGCLIASKEEIDSGKYVSQITSRDVLYSAYEGYKKSLGGRLVEGRYIIRGGVDEKFQSMRCIDIYKLGVKESIATFYENDDYKEVYYLCKDLGIEGFELDNYVSEVAVKINGVTVEVLDCETTLDLLQYNIKTLLIKLIKYVNSETLF